MASPANEGAPVFSIGNGCKCFPDQICTVEDVLMAMGSVVGHDKIISASRMNKAVVVFLEEEKFVNVLVENGIEMADTFVQVTPLRSPATRVIISNAPPFIKNEAIIKELSRFGRFASSIKTVPLGCKNNALKHVTSFRRQVFMFLQAPTKFLEVSFRIQHEESSYMIFATTESMRCFECGDLGHKKLFCPHRKQNEEKSAETESNEKRNQSELGKTSDKIEKRHTVVKETYTQPKNKKQKVQNEKQTGETQDKSSTNSGCTSSLESTQLSEGQAESDKESMSKSEVSESSFPIVLGVSGAEQSTICGNDMEVDMASGSGLQFVEEDEVCVDESRCDSDSCSEVSEFELSQTSQDLYTAEEFNDFLDQTKGQKVDVLKLFPDAVKFLRSVMTVQQSVGCDVISKQKRFRLKKMATVVRKSLKGKKKNK